MTATDQIKILNRKIRQNVSQYDLERKAAEISALSSKSLDKLELLTGEDLDLKPSTVEKVKFEYSPLGMSLNRALKKMKLKVLLRIRVILIIMVIMLFSNFTEGMMNLKKCHQIQSTTG